MKDNEFSNYKFRSEDSWGHQNMNNAKISIASSLSQDQQLKRKELDLIADLMSSTNHY